MLLPEHFEHAGDITDSGSSQTLVIVIGSTPSRPGPVHALQFYRCVGSIALDHSFARRFSSKFLSTQRKAQSMGEGVLQQYCSTVGSRAP